MITGWGNYIFSTDYTVLSTWITTLVMLETYSSWLPSMAMLILCILTSEGLTHSNPEISLNIPHNSNTNFVKKIIHNLLSNCDTQHSNKKSGTNSWLVHCKCKNNSTFKKPDLGSDDIQSCIFLVFATCYCNHSRYHEQWRVPCFLESVSRALSTSHCQQLIVFLLFSRQIQGR